MKIKDIPAIWAVLSGVITLVGAATVFIFTNFETVAASDLCGNVSRLRVEMAQKKSRMQYDVTAQDPAMQAWLKQEIEDLKAEIARLDPDGKCP